MAMITTALAGLILGLIALGLVLKFCVLPPLKEIGKLMASNSQALKDLNNIVDQLVADVTAAGTAIKGLIDDISTLHGLNPAAVEAVVAKAQAALSTLEASVKSANDTLNPPVVAVSVSPTSATVAVGATQQFTASVQNATDSTVAWSVSPPEAGTVDVNGLFTATAAGTATVTATSNQDTTKSASASVTIA